MATMDEERWLALERDYRRQVNKVYYRRESDFDTLKAYNDYLEEVEEIVEGLVNEKTRPAARAKLDKLKAADPALTARNRALFEEERMAMSLGVERERREAQQRAQQRLHQAQTEAEEQARVKAALQDEVAAGKSVSEAQAELLQRPALATKAAHHASTTNQGYSYKPMSVVQVLEEHSLGCRLCTCTRSCARCVGCPPLTPLLLCRRNWQTKHVPSRCTSTRTRVLSSFSPRSCWCARHMRTSRKSWRQCAVQVVINSKYGTIGIRMRRLM